MLSAAPIAPTIWGSGGTNRDRPVSFSRRARTQPFSATPPAKKIFPSVCYLLFRCPDPEHAKRMMSETRRGPRALEKFLSHASAFSDQVTELNFSDCVKFANENPVTYIATADGDQPRVRAFAM
jgi:hypothetical protein